MTEDKVKLMGEKLTDNELDGVAGGNDSGLADARAYGCSVCTWNKLYSALECPRSEEQAVIDHQRDHPNCSGTVTGLTLEFISL